MSSQSELLVQPFGLSKDEAESQFANLHALVGRGFAYAVEDAPFESGIYGLRMGKISMARRDDVGSHLNASLLSSGWQHLAVRVHASEVALIGELLASGFYVVDSLATFELRQPYPNVVVDTPALVRPAAKDDCAAVGEIAADAFGDSRFMGDPWLPRRLSRQLMRTWAENDCLGRADTTFIAEEEGQVLGFVSSLATLDRSRVPGGEPISIIDLIAVDIGSKGKNIGAAMMAAAMRHYADRTVRYLVGTQSMNTPATRLYTRSGFLLMALELTLHWTHPDHKKATT